MSKDLLHDVGIELERWFEAMERGARRPDPRDAEIYESAAFKAARPGAEQ